MMDCTRLCSRYFSFIAVISMLVACGEVTREDDIGPGDSGVKDISQVDSIADAPAPDQPLVMDTGIDQPVADQMAADQMAADQPIQDQFIPDQPIPDQALPDQALPDQALPDQTLPDQLAPDQFVPDQFVPDQFVPDQLMPDQGVMTPPTWVTIKAGIFKMGSPDGTGTQPKELCRQTNETQHQVTLTNNFEVQTTEVTQGQFQSLMSYNPSSFTSCGVNCPVEQVNWHEAVAYCNALSQKAGLKSCYTCTGSGKSITCQEKSEYSGQDIYTCPGYRLPTEAEWEYAYRAGTSTAFYIGGITNCSSADTNADKIGWNKFNSNSKTHLVGQKPPNAFSLYDMAGNVWEWCHDPGLSAYGSSAVTDPVGSGSSRVIRGGSWHHEPDFMRAAYRNSGTPSYLINVTGFRCARTLPPKPVAHWKFDEGKGTVANDSSKNSNTGTVHSATWATGLVGGALKFDGVKDYVSVPHSNTIDVGKGAFSFSLWFMSTGQAIQPYLMGKNYGASSKFWAINIYGQPQSTSCTHGAAAVIHDGTSTTEVGCKAGWTNNTWHHLAFVREGGSGNIKLYLDGVLNDTKSDKSGTVNSSAKIVIGKIDNSGDPRYFKGLIDDVQIFNSALTAGQIKLLYDNAPACDDGIKNGHETDVDCGGPRCNKCADTKKCGTLSDCLSGVCTSSVCIKGCTHQPVVKDCYKDAQGVEWCGIPGGCFQMGSPDGTGTQPKEKCRETKETQHQVTLTNNFEIQSTEVTQGQYKALMGSNPSKSASCGLNCPVEMTNWHMAVAFCNALSTKAGLAACYACTGSGTSVKCQVASAYSGQNVYTCPGYRLPTEAEWEYAYRAGTTTAFYNGGITNCSGSDSNASAIGWYDYNTSSATKPVGQKIPNVWGLYDLAGNVNEWPHDWYGSYSSSAVTDPWGPSTGTTRVIRGGSWSDDPVHMRAAYRNIYPQDQKHGFIGIRCIRTLKP